MSKIEDRVPSPHTSLNDDIGEEKRLDMYRMQVEIREAEQRAFDLFLQNLVKGTSHLSLGQEAVATGFAAAMRPGDLSFCTYRCKIADNSDPLRGIFAFNSDPF